MTMRALATLIFAASLMSVPVGAQQEDLGVPAPPRSVKLTANHYTTRARFADTVAYYKRWLKRRRAPHRAVPPYERRGVWIARFIDTGNARWQAIHVFTNREAKNRTEVVVVPDPKPKKQH